MAEIRSTQFQPDSDPFGANSNFVDCNIGVTMATNTSQNNVQFVSSEGQGGSVYIAGYITKGAGTHLEASLPLIAEAVKTSAKYPSVAPDLFENSLRPAIRVLQRVLNNRAGSREFGVRLCLSSLRGLNQFSCSHIQK